MQIIAKFLRDCRGTTAIEYSILAALFSLGCVAGWEQLSAAIVGMFETIASVFADNAP